MTPSTTQHGSDSDYSSSIERFIKSDSMDIEVFLQGIRDVETGREWLGECNRIGADKEKTEMVVKRIRELKKNKDSNR